MNTQRRQDGIGSGSGSAGPTSQNTDAGHDGLESWGVARLACGDAKGQGPCRAVPGEVHFRAQAAAGASEGVVVRFGPAWRPFFLSPAGCW